MQTRMRSCAGQGLLALHIGAGNVQQRVSRHLRRVDHADPDHEHQPDGGKDCPTLTVVTRHAAKQNAKGDRDQQDRNDLRRVRRDRRVFQRMRRIHPEKAAAIGAKLLDGNL